MSEAAESPLIIALLFAVRCLVPLVLMLGVTYLLRRFGLITTPPPPPPDQDNGQPNGQNGGHSGNQNSGGVAHGKV
ncbi:MAG TPA: hypothetical protein VFF59_13730 [Anaerolineae bacterium]|nr:hypothetical protein [Anaerolineae bacterium]